MKNNKVAVIGLGYVGLTFAITLAKVGFKVLGIELEKGLRPCMKFFNLLLSLLCI